MSELVMRKETLLNDGYLRKWTLYEAAKEFAQNYVFALQNNHAEGNTWFDNGTAYWEDYGEGFGLSCLLIGVGQQKDVESAPGENSEGQKIAMLVACRENKKCSIEIPGYTVRPAIERGNFDENELVLYVYKNNRTVGVKFTLECDKKVYLKANESFGYLQALTEKDREKFSTASIIDDGGNNLYINGVKINNSLKTLFSYNLIGKNLSNRDRDAISIGEINREIWYQVLGKLSDRSKIREILLNADNNTIENYETWPHYIEHRILWDNTLFDLYGDKVCYATGDKDDSRARYRHFKVIKTPVRGAISLMNFLNVRSSANVCPRKEVKRENVMLKDLTEKEHENIKRVRKLIQKYYHKDIWSLRYVENLRDEYDNYINGLCSYNEKLIYIRRDILSDWEQLFETMLHEVIHQVTKTDDCSEEFEKEWGKACLKFARGCIRSKYKTLKNTLI
jgi:hypothetical protein